MKRYPVNNRVNYILNVCRGKRVLHVGCTDTPNTLRKIEDGTLLHIAIDKVASVQYGIDLSEEGITILRNHGFKNLAVVDVQQLASHDPFGNVRFDVVVVGETIEHLPNPGLFLDAIKSVLGGADTRLILTTINAYCAARYAYTFFKGGEDVHSDHVAYYSRRTLTKLLTMQGYEIEDFSFYDIGREYTTHWRGLHSGYLLISRLFSWFRPEFASGVMVKCKLADSA